MVHNGHQGQAIHIQNVSKLFLKKNPKFLFNKQLIVTDKKITKTNLLVFLCLLPSFFKRNLTPDLTPN